MTEEQSQKFEIVGDSKLSNHYKFDNFFKTCPLCGFSSCEPHVWNKHECLLRNNAFQREKIRPRRGRKFTEILPKSNPTNVLKK